MIQLRFDRCRALFCWLVFCCLAITGREAAADVVVHKTADPFESVPWKASEDNSAGGGVKFSTDVPPDLSATSKRSLELDPVFSGGGFEFFRGVPVQPLVIPGVTKALSLWVRSGPKYGWVMQFKDGWGRSEVDGKKLEWTIVQEQNTEMPWKKITFQVPPDWVQPISIDGVLAHNWDSQTEKGQGSLGLDQLEVDTDIADVDEQTGVLKTWKPAPPPPATPGGAPSAAPKAPVTPLLQVDLAGTEEHNVFSGVSPQFLLTVHNWHPAAAVGTLQWKISGPSGEVVRQGKQALSVEDTVSLPLPLNTPQYGVYQLDSTVAWAQGAKTESSQSYAVIPVARTLTDAEKDASPYGLNVISARQPMVSTFRKAGIVWFRDYGFNYQWMVRAKGADNKYAGWPYYPRIVKNYQDNGARLLANLQTSIRPPVAGTPPGPDQEWTREIAGILLAFPSLNAVELDNEYDLQGTNSVAEEAIGWKNYGLYHKKFGEVAAMLDGGQLVTVENGRAGIWPERLRRMVGSGDFATIDVVNSHHYAGTDSPELNVINYNMGFSGDETVMTFFDQLRAAKKAGSSDGKPRQHWLTEFGWDTKAGPVVSPQEQAAYLARAYMLLSAAGTSKGFWYWDLDSATANQFFDGCGLFTNDEMPKLSYAAYAGLTQVLPTPEYVGAISDGDDTAGYLFREDDALVAALWTLDGKPGPSVDFGPAKVYDGFANPLDKKTVTLGLMPVYAVGVSRDSRWFRQSAYSLDSPHLVVVTAGDACTASLRVKNDRDTAIHGKVRLQLPAGWTDTSGETPIEVAPKQTVDIPLTFHIGTDEPLGEKLVGLNIQEDAPLTTIPLRVQIQRPIAMTVRGLSRDPGAGGVTVRLTNRSAQPLDGTLRFKLPASWSTATPQIPVSALKPGETRELQANVTWSPTWKDDESAAAEYTSADGRAVQQPLIPGWLTLHKAPSLVMDGDLKDWPADTKLPSWVLGSTQGEANAAVYMAWSTEGLYVGVETHDSKTSVPDPRSFWQGDVLEVYVDTRNKKSPRTYEPGDHQFWLAPQPDKKRVYVGQWKRGTELTETRYDLDGIRSAAVRRGDGYVMECLIPASMLKGFQPTAGARLGLNLNLSVKGLHLDREVYWRTPKSESADQPASWGTVTLAN